MATTVHEPPQVEPSRVPDDGRMVALEVFGKNIRVQDGFEHRLDRGDGF